MYNLCISLHSFVQQQIYQKASEAASSMPKPADEAASVNGGSTSISSSSSSSSGSSSSSECSSSSRSLVPTRSLPSWLTEEAVASKGVRDRLSELLSRHAQVNVCVCHCGMQVLFVGSQEQEATAWQNYLSLVCTCITMITFTFSCCISVL